MIHRVICTFTFVLGMMLTSQSASAQVLVRQHPAEEIGFPDLEFEPPTVEEHEVAGVTVLLLEDHTLPLATIYVRLNGGYGLFSRDVYAAVSALPSLIRFGGTESLAPDSVDKVLEYYAIQTSFGSGGDVITATANALVQHFPTTIDLLGTLLTEPAFDSNEVEVWRGRQIESVLRRADDPVRLAYSEFNHLLYGDHSIGWEMNAADLEPGDLSREQLLEVHSRIVCRDNLILGLAGDVNWSEVEHLVEGLVDRIKPCSVSLPESPIPTIRDEPGIYLIEKNVEQSVIVMAHATNLNLSDDPAYFSATIGNSILGGGGFSSRILSRIRTQEGFAYSAASLWTIPRRYPGLLGAVTSTRPENAVPAIKAILETMQGLVDSPPQPSEVTTAVDAVLNGFVFNFETSSQILSRMMFYLSADLPRDWLERYLAGVQGVSANSVHHAFSEHMQPEEMMVLIVGDSERMGQELLATLGPVTIMREKDFH